MKLISCAWVSFTTNFLHEDWSVVDSIPCPIQSNVTSAWGYAVSSRLLLLAESMSASPLLGYLLPISHRNVFTDSLVKPLRGYRLPDGKDLMLAPSMGLYLQEGQVFDPGIWLLLGIAASCIPVLPFLNPKSIFHPASFWCTLWEVSHDGISTWVPATSVRDPN